MAFFNNAEDRTDVVALAVGVWAAAPGADNMSELAAYYNAGGDLEGLTAELVNTPIFNQEYPNTLTNEEFATKFVDNAVGDTVEDEHKEWAVDQIASQLAAGASLDEVILAALDALRNVPVDDENWGDARVAFENKVEVAEYFSVELGKSGANLADLKGVIADVDETDASVEAGKEKAEGTTSEPGEVFTLTTGQDSVEGGAGNDTINALVDGANNTLSLGDTIDGGAGDDTLNVVTDQNTVSVNSSMVSNVEILNVDMEAATAGPSTVNLNGVAYEEARIEGATGVDTNGDTLTVSGANLATTVVLEDITDIGPTVNFTGATGSSDSATVEVAGASSTTAGDNNLTVANIETLNLDFTTASNSLDTVTAGAAKTLNVNVASGANTTLNSAAAIAAATAVNIEAEGNLTLGATADVADEAAFTVSGSGDVDLDTLDTSGGDGNTVDASALTGNLTVAGSADTASITGGSGDDDITSAANSTAIVAGAGDDRVALGAVDYGTAGAETVSGGDGTDILNLTTSTNMDAGFFANVTGFEILSVAGGSGSYDVSTASFDGVIVDGALGGSTTIAGITDETVDITASTGGGNDLTLALDDATGSSDELTTTIEGAATTVSMFVTNKNDITVDELVYADIETVTLESNNHALHTKGENNTVTNLSTDAAEVVVTGNHALEITGFSSEAAGSAAVNTSIDTIDASASAGLIMGGALSNTGVSLIGSENADTLLVGTVDGTNTSAETGSTINAGGGGDIINLDAASGASSQVANTLIIEAGDSQIGYIDTDASETYTAAGDDETFDIVSAFVSGTDSIDLGSFGFSGQQASALAGATLTSAEALALVDGTTTEIEDFFVDTGIQRGVATVTDDFSNIGGATGDTLVFIDSNGDGNLTVADDDMILLSGAGGVTLGDFGF